MIAPEDLLHGQGVISLLVREQEEDGAVFQVRDLEDRQVGRGARRAGAAAEEDEGYREAASGAHGSRWYAIPRAPHPGAGGNTTRIGRVSPYALHSPLPAVGWAGRERGRG